MAWGGPSSSTNVPMGVSSSSISSPRAHDLAAGKLIGGAVFFVAEPPAHAQAFEYFYQIVGVGDLRFDFIPHFMRAGRRIAIGGSGQLLGALGA